VAEPRQRCHIRGALRKYDRVGCRCVDGAVVLVQKQVLARAEHFLPTEERHKTAHQWRAAEAGANGGGRRQEAAPV